MIRHYLTYTAWEEYQEPNGGGIRPMAQVSEEYTDPVACADRVRQLVLEHGTIDVNVFVGEPIEDAIGRIKTGMLS